MYCVKGVSRAPRRCWMRRARRRHRGTEGGGDVGGGGGEEGLGGEVVRIGERKRARVQGLGT